MVGECVYAMKDIRSARGLRRKSLLSLLLWQPYVLLITTVEGEREILRHRNGYFVFQLAKAIEAAVRELRGEPRLVSTAALGTKAAGLTGSLAT
jgi:hypothetical protein